RSTRQAVFAGWPSHPATHAGAKPKMERTTTRAEQQRTVLVRRGPRKKVSVDLRSASLRAGRRQLGRVFLFAYPGLTLPRLRSGQALGYKSVAATRLARWPTPSIARLFKSCLCLCLSVVKTQAGSSLRWE